MLWHPFFFCLPFNYIIQIFNDINNKTKIYLLHTYNKYKIYIQTLLNGIQWNAPIIFNHFHSQFVIHFTDEIYSIACEVFIVQVSFEYYAVFCWYLLSELCIQYIILNSFIGFTIVLRKYLLLLSFHIVLEMPFSSNLSSKLLNHKLYKPKEIALATKSTKIRKEIMKLSKQWVQWFAKNWNKLNWHMHNWMNFYFVVVNFIMFAISILLLISRFMVNFFGCQNIQKSCPFEWLKSNYFYENNMSLYKYMIELDILVYCMEFSMHNYII